MNEGAPDFPRLWQADPHLEYHYRRGLQGFGANAVLSVTSISARGPTDNNAPIHPSSLEPLPTVERLRFRNCSLLSPLAWLG